ncbi:unnamed protein product [Trifolium pratense]|uniref:Uncharacterized protein n=1 Tax=Trifolium pratense TaxID=57577 RepID=A0ACB0K3E5_TRIPR|nr:unnamed protein product [Trifolium pratense]
MQLSWFWVKELRIADPILDWEKMKRTMSDGLLLRTPKNNNSSVTMRTLLLDSSWKTYLFDKEMLLARISFIQCSNTTLTPPPKTPYQYFRRKKVLFQVFHYHFLVKGCDSSCVWMYYDEMEKWLLRGMWIYIMNGTNLFIYCAYHDPLEDHDYPLRLFDQMSKCLMVSWDAIFSRSIHYEFDNISPYLTKGFQRVNIKLVKCTFTNMLHWCSLKFFVYGRHINNVVIIRRLLVRIYVVRILATKCFDHICVLVPYEEFEEVEHAFHIHHTPNYMMVNIVNMDWLENALTVFRDMCCWDSFSPTEASGESIALLEIYNSYDHETEESQLLANYHDAILKLLIAISDTHKPFVDFLHSSWSLKCCLQELAEINEMNGSVDSSNEFKILLHQSQVLAHELHLVNTWICLSDCRCVLENIHRYFYDIAMGRRFNFISLIGGNAIALLCLYIMQSNLGHPKLILELLTEAVCVEQQQQWFVPLNGPLWRGIVVGFPSFQKCLDITRENDFSVPEFQLLTHVVFGSNIWIGSTIFLLSFGFQARNINIVSTVSKYIGLIVHASIVGHKS